MKKFINVAFSLLLVLTGFVASAETKSLCVFDLLGANGPIYAQMKDYKIAALDWGVSFRLKPYINELHAAADFKSGLCNAVSFTGIQSRQFNPFSGTLDAMGALPSYQHLKIVISSISSEQAIPLMINEPYEVVGVIPMGAAFLFVNDRSLVSDYADTEGDLSRIRIAVMDSDPAQAELVGLIGTSSVADSIAGMYSKFNSGLVDVTYGPAIVFEAMELRRGLKNNGGVVRFPLAQLSLQIMIRRAEFPENFGKKSRQYALSQFDKAIMRAKSYEDRIAQKWWINISEADQKRYHQMYRKTRVSLRNKGVYDARMLRLLRVVRCKQEPQRAECIADDKE
ncbi:MAG: putative solute-binding protein [Methylococcaceae bacterium]